MMNRVLIISRRIHRLFVISSLILIISMGSTGILLKLESLGVRIPTVDLIFVRSLHSNLSVFLTLDLIIMALTGLLMYVGPEVIKAKNNNQNAVSEIPQTPKETPK